MNKPAFASIAVSIGLAFTLNAASLPPKQVEFFENKIRPILAENCYECHNSVDKAKGDIALDWRDATVESGIIVPGNPAKSTLIQAIRHAEDYEPMPSKKPKLAKLIIKNFEEWVRMGAPDPRDTKPTKEELASQVDWDAVRDRRKAWWSYQPIRDPQAPKVQDADWHHSPIDRFVRAKLEAEGIKPQAEAAPEVLIRRLHQVLIGIPPEPDVVEAFTANPTSEAYGKIVDQLLTSKRFGERWGRYWLDWFRYAESHGSEGDPDVPYPTVYRDYVIRALNNDVPYDQLIREHIAGDLLETPRVNEDLELNESAIGLGHFRMVPHGFGVTDAYDEQVTFTDNQVDVVTKAILGSTLSCARCHNHKFDPLSQKDFYKFYGMMISSRPAVVNVDSPELQQKNRAELKTLKAEIHKGLAQHWIDQVPAIIDAMENDSKTLGDLKKAALKNETHPLHAWFKLHQANPETLAREWPAMQQRHKQRVEENATRIDNATFYADLRDQKTYDQWFKNGTGLGDQVSPAGSFAIAASGNKALVGIYPRGVYTHLLTDKDNATLNSVFHQAKGSYTGVRGIGHNATARFSVRSYALMHGGLHPTPKLDGEMKWIGINKYKYWNGEKLFYQLTTAPDQTYRTGKGRSWFGITEVYGGDQALTELGNPAITLPGVPDTLLDRQALQSFYQGALVDALQAWRRNTMSDSQAALVEAFRRHGVLKNELASLPAPLKASVEKYRALENEIREPVRAPGVMEGQPWDQPLLGQGIYKNEEEPVARGFLEVFGGREYSKQNSGRRELVEDLLSKENTLTARVIVNRLWHHTFGSGLVTSTDNFGRLGKPPSHPELLDHLATRFQTDDQWSIKQMIRRLVTSRTFMSGSEAPEGVVEADPTNRLLSYYSPRRLDAEAIFDTLSFLAGNSQQPAIYRRAKRNRLDPFLAAFNYPIPTTSVGVRDLTNVPAQSLIMMNGAETRNAAGSWARRIQSDRNLATDTQRITALFQQAYSRKPRPEEVSACISYLEGKSDDGSLQKLIEEHAALDAQVNKIRTTRDRLLAPTRTRLQAAADARNKAAKEKDDQQPVDLKPIARWDFEGDAKDMVGSLHGKIVGKAQIKDGALELKGGAVFTEPIKQDLKAKTLEVLIQLDNTNQRGGGAITLQDLQGSVFDGLVYAEITGKEWLAGSNNHKRTVPYKGPADSEVGQRPVRMVLVFHADGSSQAYRDGKPYGKKIRKAEAATFTAGKAQMVFGLRHGTRPGGGRSLTGKIFEARLYDRALTSEEVAAAASGEHMDIVTRQDVQEALSASARDKLRLINERLGPAEAELNKLTLELNDQRAAANGIPGGLTRLTHVLLNSKELIYVY